MFIPLWHICSRKSDYLFNREILCKKIIELGFHEKEWKKTIKQEAKRDRSELLQDRTRENKDPQTILVSTWHPKLSAIPSLLKNNFHLISPDHILSKIFKQKPNVTYRKTNHSLVTFWKRYCKSITSFQLKFPTSFPQMNTAKIITNNKLNIMKKWKVLETARKGKSFTLHHARSTKSYILDIQGNNFQSAFLNIATTSRTGQTTANLQNNR